MRQHHLLRLKVQGNPPDLLAISLQLLFSELAAIGGVALSNRVASGSCDSGSLLRSSDLVISKEGTPGTAGEHEGLHERSFGLDGVHQIVRGPRLKHL